jgi:chromate transporter
MQPHTQAPYRSIAALFLKLGITGFGGPAVHIALMEDEVVRRRGWLSRAEFLDLAGAVNLIPGPNSTELALHIGHRKGGWPGFFLAGICFILPAAVIVTALAWIYVRYGALPEAGGLLYGLRPVLIAVVLQALWSLGRTALKSSGLWLLAAAGMALNFLGIHELLILAAAGAAGLAHRLFSGAPVSGLGLLPAALAPPLFAQTAAAAGTTAASAGLGSLFLFFLKVGSLLFGSGYVLLAFLRADLVERWQWLSEAQLLDAVSAGQITPGPVFTTATFIGYMLAGFPGAVVATIGIFIPAFLFVALSGSLVPRLRRSATAGAVLDGVNAASLALMAVVTWQLGRAALVDGLTVGIALVSAVLLLLLRVNSAWLILGGAVAGLVAG